MKANVHRYIICTYMQKRVQGRRRKNKTAERRVVCRLFIICHSVGYAVPLVTQESHLPVSHADARQLFSN